MVTMEQVVEERQEGTVNCMVPDCMNVPVARNLCEMHLRRLARTGVVFGTNTRYRASGDKPTTCQVCGRTGIDKMRNTSRGLCRYHYRLMMQMVDDLPSADEAELLARVRLRYELTQAGMSAAMANEVSRSEDLEAAREQYAMLLTPKAGTNEQ